MYDLIFDAEVLSGRLRLPARVSFTRDVLPILRRLTNLQWVNQGFAAMFGKGAPMDFDNPKLIDRLGKTPFSDPELRHVILKAFRPSATTVNEPRLWPWIYGDGIEVPGSINKSQIISPVRETILRRWAADLFEDDRPRGKSRPIRKLSDIKSSAERAAMLDKAALHYCVADAFHPGSELGWPMRHTTMYRRPFRIRRRGPGPAPDHGDHLTPRIAMSIDGPLYEQGPGDLTRWMSLPWQADTVFCRAAYFPDYDAFLPSYWPARVPNHIVTEADYAAITNLSRSRADRLAVFRQRSHWHRMFKDQSYQDQLETMVKVFASMGILEARPGIKGDPDFPEVFFVETFSESGFCRHGLMQAAWSEKISA
jgi:hypothetical protein